MTERIPVLFDTDIGSDIDDAVALAYLLCEPRCELLGITTVTGEPIARAQLADAVCRAAGRPEVPIYAGCEQPLLVEQRQPEAPQKAVLSRWSHRSDFSAGEAVQFMRETIRSRPGEVTLLAVGPFTNVGVLFALDPEIPRLLRRLVVMGGVFTTAIPGAGRVEWNACVDPHATAIMVAASCPTTAFGLDVTKRCRLSAVNCRERLRGGVLDVVADMAEVWFARRPEITFHDPLAAVAMFYPELCTYERGRVEVELASPRVAGMTHWTPGEDGPHEVAVDVNANQFFERYFEVFEDVSVGL